MDPLAELAALYTQALPMLDFAPTERFSTTSALALLSRCTQAPPEPVNAASGYWPGAANATLIFRADQLPELQVFVSRQDWAAEPWGAGRITPGLRERLPASWRLPDVPLWIAGHGIGGALAVLAAQQLAAARHSIRGVYTFGAPRVGDAAFVRSLAFPLYRVVNGIDLLADVPPPWPFQHAGQHHLLASGGRLLTQPKPWQRAGDLLSQTAWLSELLRQGLRGGYSSAVAALFRRTAGDHAPRAYWDALTRVASHP